MFDNIINFFKKSSKNENKASTSSKSKNAAKERLHLVLMQDRANVSADFLELMKQEIIDVIKKYIDIDESAIDVRLTNKENEDGTNGAPALYANIPIVNIKNESKKVEIKNDSQDKNVKTKKEEKSNNENKKIEEDKKESEKEIKDNKEEKVEEIEESVNKDTDNVEETKNEDSEDKIKSEN